MNILGRTVYQDNDESNCGQCCIATLLGITKDEAIKLAGKAGRTRPTQLNKILEPAGLRLLPPKRIIKAEDPKLPSRALLKMKIWDDGEKLNHWVLWEDGYLFCPNRGIYNNIYNGLDWKKLTDPKQPRRYITSYWEIVEC